MITTVCKISYGSQTVPPIVPAVQGDTGRAISFEIADFTPPAGATATYFILKPSGEAIYNSATITDNSILCELTAQSLAEAGENRMQVRVLQGEDIVTSFEVILMVRTFLGDDAIESGTEMNIFDQAVEQATEQFQENAEQIVEEVIESIPSDYTELTEEVDELNERLDTEGLSEDAKVALLACFEHVGWTDEYGQSYYNALRLSLYPKTLQSITAVISLGTHVVFMNDSIETLREYITVTAHYSDGTTDNVIAYSITGDISTEGTHTLAISYDGKTTYVDVPVTWGYRLTSASGEIAVGGIIFFPADVQTTKYFDNTNVKRFSNKTFLPWETGYDCYVEADTALNVVVSVNCFNQLAMNAVSNMQEITTSNVGRPGWQSSNPSLSVMPDSVNNSPVKTIRCTFKTVPTESTFSENAITEVRITRRAKQ